MMILTEKQKRALELFRALSAEEQAEAIALAEALAQQQAKSDATTATTASIRQ